MVQSEDSIIRQTIMDLTQFCEREGLDLIETFGPDLEKTVRMLKARGEALEREEMSRGGKLLEFPSGVLL